MAPSKFRRVKRTIANIRATITSTGSFTAAPGARILQTFALARMVRSGEIEIIDTDGGNVVYGFVSG